jgi:hypothetical protein
MRRRQAAFIFAVLCLTVACSPRDFLTRRLATDLIAGSETFKTTQLFWLRTGVISNIWCCAGMAGLPPRAPPAALILDRRHVGTS